MSGESRLSLLGFGPTSSSKQLIAANPLPNLASSLTQMVFGLVSALAMTRRRRDV